MKEVSTMKTQNRIKELRKEQGLTLRQFGQKVGLNNSAISQYENGKREPGIAKWEIMATALGVSAAYLVGWTDKNDRSERKASTVNTGRRIKSLRMQAGLTQSELALRVNIYSGKKTAQSGTINNWEQGVNLPNKQRLKILAELFDVDIETLVSL